MHAPNWRSGKTLSIIYIYTMYKTIHPTFVYRYNDISPLENHHCSIAFRLLEHPECNIFKNFSRDTFK